MPEFERLDAAFQRYLLPVNARLAVIDARITGMQTRLVVLQQQVATMGISLQAQLAADFTAMQNTLTNLGNDVTAINNDFSQFIASLQPGSALTPEQVQQAGALATAFATIDINLQQAVTTANQALAGATGSVTGATGATGAPGIGTGDTGAAGASGAG